MNEVKKSCMTIFRILSLYATIIIFSASCSHDDERYHYSAIHCLRFTDNEDFVYLQPEQIIVDSSSQTITLTLKGVVFIDPIPTPTKYRITVDKWDDDKERWETSPNEYADFYNVYIKNDNDETVVYIELKENLCEFDRKIRLDIDPGLVIGNYFPYGLVDITQLPSKKESDVFCMKAKYKGRLYSTEAEIDPNGDLSFLDPEYASLMKEIDSMDYIKMFVLDNETTYYYDREDIQTNQVYNDILSLEASNNNRGISTRADGFEYDDPSYLGYFAIFDNDHFKGSNITKGLTNFHYTHNLQDLKSFSMNDKVTSIAVGYNSDDDLVCSVLTIWEDTDYNYYDDNRSKHRISIIASKNSPKISIPDLKKIKRIGSSKSWNDCISSISFHFGYVDRLLLDY